MNIARSTARIGSLFGRPPGPPAVTISAFAEPSSSALLRLGGALGAVALCRRRRAGR